MLRALDSVGLSEQDIEIVPLQHPDGKLALERGDVQVWAGLDPLMASAELQGGARLFFRNPDWNSYGVLNVRAEFAERYPAYVERVLAAYERAHARALAEAAELKAALAKEANLEDAVAARVLERTDLSSTAIGDTQLRTIVASGDVLKRSSVIAFGVFFPVYLNLTTGLAAIDRRLVEVGELFGYRGWRLARYLLVPAVLPSYITGLRSGLGLGWMFVVAAELMGASRGLGYVLVDGQTTSRPELVMAAILLFALLGKCTDLALERLVRRS